MRGVGEMRGQLAAGRNRFGTARQFRHLGDKREVADQFAAAPEVACGRDADDTGRASFRWAFQPISKARPPVHMALPWDSRRIASLVQDLGLQRRAQPLDLLQPSFARGLLQFCERSYARARCRA